MVLPDISVTPWWRASPRSTAHAIFRWLNFDAFTGGPPLFCSAAQGAKSPPPPPPSPRPFCAQLTLNELSPTSLLLPRFQLVAYMSASTRRLGRDGVFTTENSFPRPWQGWAYKHTRNTSTRGAWFLLVLRICAHIPQHKVMHAGLSELPPLLRTVIAT